MDRAKLVTIFVISTPNLNVRLVRDPDHTAMDKSANSKRQFHFPEDKFTINYVGDQFVYASRYKN